MKSIAKIGLALVILLALAVGAIAIMGVVESNVKAQYPAIDKNSPCRISGTGFDTMEQQRACEAYITANAQKEKQDSDWAKSQQPIKALPKITSKCEIENRDFEILQKNYLKASQNEKPYMKKNLEKFKDDLWNNCDINVQIQG